VRRGEHEMEPAGAGGGGGPHRESLLAGLGFGVGFLAPLLLRLSRARSLKKRGGGMGTAGHAGRLILFAALFLQASFIFFSQ
jgi:hypothetical protein